jgi:hypothetical protein
MKEKKFFRGRLLISWGKETRGWAWDVDFRIHFWSTVDIRVFSNRLIFEWD